VLADLPQRVVVLGAGTMGVRIALCFSRCDVTVSLVSRRAETLDRAAEDLQRCAANYAPNDEGPTAQLNAEDVLSRISLSTDPSTVLWGADLVVETIPEVVEEKIALLERLDELVGPETIVTTNTSGLNLETLSSATSNPERFVGLHWFNPADLIRLVEVVPTASTAVGTVDTVRSWMVHMGKVPVVLNRSIPGFVANRLQYALLREAYALVSTGVCSFEDVDMAVTSGLGPRWASLGPFQTMDFAGLDVHLAVAKALFPVLANDDSPPDVLASFVRDVHLGIKSGTGLRGDYSTSRTERLSMRRDAMLRTTAKVQDQFVDEG
jgi:3-hydroxybutyryl-CoA dehydrogenase